MLPAVLYYLTLGSIWGQNACERRYAEHGRIGLPAFQIIIFVLKCGSEQMLPNADLTGKESARKPSDPPNSSSIDCGREITKGIVLW